MLEDITELATLVIEGFEDKAKYHLEKAERLKAQIEEHQQRAERLHKRAQQLKVTMMRLEGEETHE